jgi:hypothetical protein
VSGEEIDHLVYPRRGLMITRKITVTILWRMLRTARRLARGCAGEDRADDWLGVTDMRHWWTVKTLRDHWQISVLHGLDVSLRQLPHARGLGVVPTVKEVLVEKTAALRALDRRRMPIDVVGPKAVEGGVSRSQGERR